MKLTKTDAFNLSCLKLCQIDKWSIQKCIDQLELGTRSKRAQERYVKRMVELLHKIDTTHPNLIEDSFKKNVQPTLDELEEVHHGRSERNKEKTIKKS